MTKLIGFFRMLMLKIRTSIIQSLRNFKHDFSSSQLLKLVTVELFSLENI